MYQNVDFRIHIKTTLGKWRLFKKELRANESKYAKGIVVTRNNPKKHWKEPKDHV